MNNIPCSFSLNSVNTALLIVLGISLIAKYLLKFLGWRINRYLSRDKKHELKCLYSKQSNNQFQCQLHYGDKYLKNNLCQKNKCPAYTTSTYSFEAWKNARFLRFLVFSTFENLSELVSIVLVLYNLLK